MHVIAPERDQFTGIDAFLDIWRQRLLHANDLSRMEWNDGEWMEKSMKGSTGVETR